ncbi:MHS family MFS transporter [Schumannella soli]|uniref:MHS family MFS transporter n=2 Tax=Schumannella soli TaxID=2590779 RepID=A0A506Y0S8_9MICO|nr:MFS transporter [Schumannella soli]TPW74009.1 MHS family MFS transporter [Schumannella soli]
MTETMPPGTANPGGPGGDPASVVVKPTRRQSVRSAIAVGFGSAIEWYDYGLYAFVAGLIIAPLFFSGATGAVGLLASFGTFAVGFVARPIGGLVLGALSDRWGRRPVLMLSILMIGIATTLIGCLPPYASIGVAAPIMLVILRLIQGFGAGAELAGAITMVNESAQLKRKGFFSSLAMAGAGAGGLLALIIFTTSSTVLGPEEFSSWGWRIPFLFSAVLTIIGVVMRRKLHESPEFEAVERERKAGLVREARRNPFVAFARAFKASPRNWIAGFLIPSGLNVTGYIVTAFGISYLVGTVGLPQNQALFVSLSCSLVMLIFVAVFGAVSDRIGSKRVIYISVIGAVVWVVPYYLILNTGNLAFIIVASGVMLALGWAAGSAAHTVLMPAFFKAEFRSAGLFSSRELQGALIAGPAPLIATAIVVATGGAPWGAAGLIIVAQLLTLVGVLIAKPWVSAAEKAETPALAGITPRED